eukprot:4762328-Lingulodinium_polyedra.AAC.1
MGACRLRSRRQPHCGAKVEYFPRQHSARAIQSVVATGEKFARAPHWLRVFWRHRISCIAL